jgi:osmotically-inducible protein OsmY
MKKHLSLLTILLFFIFPSLLISSCGEKDSTIQAAVESALNENKDLSGIAASVKDGVVTLTGECKDDMSKSSLESIVGKIKGVKQVVNNCTIAPPPPAPAPVVISEDDALTKSVKDATKDYPSVTASVKDGVITLTGDIKRNQLQKLMMTLHTLKPKKIDNQLTIK